MGNLTWRPPGAGFPRGLGLLRGNDTGANCFPLTSRSIHPKLSLSKCSARWDLQEKGSLETLSSFPLGQRPGPALLLPHLRAAALPSPQQLSAAGIPNRGSPRPRGPSRAARRTPKVRLGGEPRWRTGPAVTAPNCGDQFALCPGARARGPCPRALARGFPRPRVGGAGFPSRRPRLPPAVTTHLLFRG